MTDQHYLDIQGALHFLSAKDQEHAIKYSLPLPDPSWVVATDAQVQAIINPPLTPAQLVVMYEAAAQDLLDATAVSWGYLDCATCITYAGSTVAKFSSDAKAISAWRDAIWTECYAILTSVNAGTMLIPSTTAEFLKLLPPTPSLP